MPTGHASLMPALKRVVLIGTRAERTDGQLLGAFVADRDADAFGLLVRRHGPMVLGVCRRVIGDHQSAEDAFQAVFLVLARRAATVRPREQVGNWLYGVAYRTALKARGVLARRRSREKQVVVMPEPPATHTPPEWADLQPVIDEELSRLPEKLRGPVVLCDIEGRPQREVAKHLGVPPATLATRLAAARRTLAQRLTKRGVALSGGAVAGLLTIHGSAAAVPHALAHGLARAAEAVAAGGAVSTLVSANAVQLSEGVLRMMLLTKLKAVAVAAMTAITLTGGLGLGLVPARAGGAGDDPAAAAVAKVVPAQIPPAADEARVEVALKAAAGGSVDDETFLKRMTLDLRGDLPTDIETFFFVDDRDDDKRAKVVAWLLDDDATREFAAKQLGVEAHRVVQVQAVDAGDGQPRRMVIVVEADEKGGKPAAHAVPVKGVAFSPDGKRLAVEVTPRVQMLDAKSGKVIELNAQVEGLKDRVIEVRGKGVPGAGGVLRLEALPGGGLFQPVQQPGAKPGEPGKKVVVWEAKDVQAVDGKPVVGLFSSVDDGVVRVWQAADGKKFEVTKTAKVAQGGGSDADFLRRAVTAARGREPSDLEQKYFTEDKDPKKREKLLDALLKEPEVQKKLGEDFKKRMLAGGADGVRETKGYRVVPLQGKEGFFGFQVDPKFDGKQFEFKLDPKAFQFKLPDNLKV
ncbi:MAG TPA: sigma-70 family RNA polymerase sigma factor, partial [Gemmata sp.]|nr:sigma-70 family RNA polymerase sigma factor [Gemmata sp.]